MIFLSGDDAACRETEDLIPGITTAAVKIGLSRTSAISYPPSEAHRRIREGIKKAIQQHRKKNIRPLKWKGPYVLEKKFFHTGNVDHYAQNPMAKIIDPQILQLHSKNILDIIYA
jgi:D-amino peptidase